MASVAVNGGVHGEEVEGGVVRADPQGTPAGAGAVDPSAVVPIRDAPSDGPGRVAVGDTAATEADGAAVTGDGPVEGDGRRVAGSRSCGATEERHTARRVWQRLVEEKQAVVGESTVRRYVAEARRRQPAVLAKVSVPQTHPPGAEAEVDFGQLSFSWPACPHVRRRSRPGTLWLQQRAGAHTEQEGDRRRIHVLALGATEPYSNCAQLPCWGSSGLSTVSATGHLAQRPPVGGPRPPVAALPLGTRGTHTSAWPHRGPRTRG